MSFTPVIPLSGLSGWQFLQRTQERQQAIFETSPEIQRNVEYFKENIGSVESISDLVTDRKLLTVALEAFGLSEEINKQAFVRKVLEEGTDERTSFANRLANSDYIALTETFSFANVEGFSPTSSLIDDVVEKYKNSKFEAAIGEVDEDMRLALNFQREIKDLADHGYAEDTGWLKVLGSEPLRTVIESVFNLPEEFSQINLDQQVESLKDKAYLMFGSKSIDVFSDPAVIDDAISQYQLRQQIENGPDSSTPGYTALALLSGINSSDSIGSEGILNILLSNS